MASFLKSAKKAIAGGIAAALAAAGIVAADLDWRAIFAAFVIGVLGVYFAPSNEEVIDGNHTADSNP